MKETCKARLTLVRGKEILRAKCWREPGHDGKHTGPLCDKDGNPQMMPTWHDKNERWVKK